MQLCLRPSVAAGLALLASSCTSTTEVTLPALDASNAMKAKAIVVSTDSFQRYQGPDRLVRGSGQGAANATGEYLRNPPSGEAGWLWLLTLPVTLPISATVGAAMAHSEEDVDAALAAYDGFRHDTAILDSFGRSVTRALRNTAAGDWACIETASVTGPEPCKAYKSISQIELRPYFRLEVIGRYDPDIYFFGTVSANVSADHAEAHDYVRGKWAYHEELGDFFDLTENNAALLKQELREIIGRFAESIVEDLFVNPHQDVMLRTEFGGLSGASIPQGIVVRVGLADNVRECQKLSPLSAEYAFACTNEKPAAEGENSGRGSGAHLTGCSDAEHPERPWIGKWAAQTDNAHFTFDIKKEVVRGRLKSGSKEFPIQGKVDESGVIDAKTLAEVMKVVQ